MLELFWDSNKGSRLSYLPVQCQTCNWKVVFGEEKLLKNTLYTQNFVPFFPREKENITFSCKCLSKDISKTVSIKSQAKTQEALLTPESPIIYP